MIRVHVDDTEELEDYYTLHQGELFTGIVFETYEDGSLKAETTMENGRFSGIHKMWHPNGQLKEFEDLSGNIPCGIHKFWSSEGKLLQESLINNLGNILSKKTFHQSGVLSSNHQFHAPNYPLKYTTIEKYFEGGQRKSLDTWELHVHTHHILWNEKGEIIEDFHVDANHSKWKSLQRARTEYHEWIKNGKPEKKRVLFDPEIHKL